MIKYIFSKISFFSFVSFLFITSFSSSFAQYRKQQFEITPFAGYIFPGNLQTIDGEMKIQNHLNYGLTIDIRTSEDLFIEILYDRTDTEVRFQPEYFDSTKTLFNASIEYFQAGAHIEVETGPFRPFAAFTLGATHTNPDKNNVNSDLKFSFTAGGGIKYYFTDNLGVRLQWRFLIPIYFSSASIFCNNGICDIYVSGGTYLLQYDLTGGLVVCF